LSVCQAAASGKGDKILKMIACYSVSDISGAFLKFDSSLFLRTFAHIFLKPVAVKTLWDCSTS
jgi:hypothetical protein